MRVLGFEEVRLDKLQMPGDLRKRVETENVRELAEDLKEWGGFLHEPTVRKADGRIVAGRDRIAAAHAAGRETIVVKLVECTDHEATWLEVLENLRRRHDNQPELRKRLVDLMVEQERRGEQLSHTPPEITGRVKRGRPKSERAAAREEIAKRTGVPLSTVKRSDNEARAKEKEPEGSSWWDDESPPAIETLGVEVPADLLETAGEVQRFIDEADGLLRRAQATLTNLSKVEGGLPVARFQRLYKAAAALAHDIRESRPVSVCPFCKAIPELQSSCSGCFERGYIVQDQLANVPRELLDPDAKLVASNGRFLPMAKVPRRSGAQP